MADVFEDKPDERQAPEGVELKVSRFRPRYRQLTEQEKSLHDDIKRTAELMEVLFMRTPNTRERSIAFTKLEEAVMWSVKGLTG